MPHFVSAVRLDDRTLLLFTVTTTSTCTTIIIILSVSEYSYDISTATNFQLPITTSSCTCTCTCIRHRHIISSISSINSITVGNDTVRGSMCLCIIINIHSRDCSCLGNDDVDVVDVVLLIGE